MGSLRGEAPHKPQGGFGGGEAPPKNFRGGGGGRSPPHCGGAAIGGVWGGGAPHNKGMQIYKFIKKGGIGLHMGRYGLILCANESYTNNLAIGTIVDPISGHIKSKNTKIYKMYTKIQKKIQKNKYIYIYPCLGSYAGVIFFGTSGMFGTCLECSEQCSIES